MTINLMRGSIQLLCFFLLVGTAPSALSGQINNDVPITIKNTYPPLALKKSEMAKAKTLSDLNPQFNPEWVRKYQRVVMTTYQKGEKYVMETNNQYLSEIQKKQIAHADNDKGIDISIEYIPENTLKHNDVKEFHFTIPIYPEVDAHFAGEEAALNSYLEDKIIHQISDYNFQPHQLLAVRFAINTGGKVVDVDLYETSGQEKVDKLLLEAICNMPDWEAARYEDNTKGRQTFALLVGDMSSCILPLLNVRMDH